MNRRGGTALTVVWEVGPARDLPTRYKLRLKTMGGSLVAGLRPEASWSVSESTWLKAKCWLGPAFAAKVK